MGWLLSGRSTGTAAGRGICGHCPHMRTYSGPSSMGRANAGSERFPVAGQLHGGSGSHGGHCRGQCGAFRIEIVRVAERAGGNPWGDRGGRAASNAYVGGVQSIVPGAARHAAIDSDASPVGSIVGGFPSPCPLFPFPISHFPMPYSLFPMSARSGPIPRSVAHSAGITHIGPRGLATL
jgi:hypothetical protein